MAINAAKKNVCAEPWSEQNHGQRPSSVPESSSGLGLPMDHMSPEHLEHSFHQDPTGGLDAPTDGEHSLGDNDSGYANFPLIQPASPE